MDDPKTTPPPLGRSTSSGRLAKELLAAPDFFPQTDAGRRTVVRAPDDVRAEQSNSFPQKEPPGTMPNPHQVAAPIEPGADPAFSRKLPPGFLNSISSIESLRSKSLAKKTAVVGPIFCGSPGQARRPIRTSTFKPRDEYGPATVTPTALFILKKPYQRGGIPAPLRQPFLGSWPA